MDKAVVGYMRIGYFRIGVFRDDWDCMLETMKNIPTPKKIIAGGNVVKAGEGNYRAGVHTDDFEMLKKAVENAS